MKLSYFPQIKTVHVSKNYYGQVYIPFANWILMIGTVIVTGVYTNVRNLVPLHCPWALTNIAADD
jgi:KUP system potassium uptake protein